MASEHVSPWNGGLVCAGPAGSVRRRAGRCIQVMYRRRPRGFSLFEMVTVLAVAGVAAAAAVPAFQRMRDRGRMRTTAKVVAGHIEEAKTIARSGRAGYAGWTDEDRVVQAGIRFRPPDQYELFVDANHQADGAGEEVVTKVKLDSRYTLRPGTSELRFRRNGTLVDASEIEIALEDEQAGLEWTVSVVYGGRVRVEK